MAGPLYSDHPLALILSVMNLNPSQLNVVLEEQDDGTAVASVLEIPYWRVAASTSEQALEDLQQLLRDRLHKIKIIPLEIQPDQHKALASVLDPVEASKRGWLKYAGIFENNPYFDQIMEAIQAERDSDDESEVDPSVYGGDRSNQ
jgi:predicted RNase H-like HicB family nuclease